MPTWNDLSPLANPLNSAASQLRNSCRGYVRHTADPKTLTVPNQDIPYNGSPEWQAMRSNNLTVPNQDVPYCDMSDNFGNCGFLNDRLFRLADGTVMDFRTGRIIQCRGSKHSPPPGYWNDPTEEIPQQTTGCWDGHDGPSLDELINHTEKWVGTAIPGGEPLEPMDPQSAAYWLHAEEEAEKLRAEMTDEQKETLAAFEARFPKSRLIEESRKIQNGRII